MHARQLALTLCHCLCFIFAGQNFVLSLFDRLWHKDLTEEEAVRLMELGIEEVEDLSLCLFAP